MIEDIKEELTERIDLLQKEMKKVRSLASQSTTFGAPITPMLSRQQSPYRMPSDGAAGAIGATNVNELKSKLDEHTVDIENLKTQVEVALLSSSSSAAAATAKPAGDFAAKKDLTTLENRTKQGFGKMREEFNKIKAQIVEVTKTKQDP